MESGGAGGSAEGGGAGVSRAPAVGPLAVSGSQIVDASGEPVSFAGKSLFWNIWSSKYWNAELVNWLATDWGIRIIRAPMAVEEGGGYIDSPATNQAQVETIVNAAIAADLYVIIDWHSHAAEEHQAEAITFFTEMATKYGDHDNVIYEIYNEPLAVSWSDVIKPYAEAVIAAIRAIDSDNLIIVGTPNWSQDVHRAAADPITSYGNVAYTLHFYSIHASLRQRATTAMDAGIALMVTEWGTFSPTGCAGADEAETLAWMEYCQQANLSHVNWAIVAIDECSTLKPVASSTGGWADSDLTDSGLLVKGIIENWPGNVK
jgi:aryl-phospho-beta-D-glucosidase BglC (GH1 family)